MRRVIPSKTTKAGRRYREIIPDVGLVSDIIVGFPSETESQFQQTVNLLTGLRFDAVHLAAYSPGPAPSPPEMADDVRKTRKKTSKNAGKPAGKHPDEINADLKGKIVEIL